MSSGYIFSDKSQLQSALGLWSIDENSAVSTYGDINTWDVSEITDFSYLFWQRATFNSDISNWDVSSGNDFSFKY